MAEDEVPEEEKALLGLIAAWKKIVKDEAHVAWYFFQNKKNDIDNLRTRCARITCFFHRVARFLSLFFLKIKFHFHCQLIS